MFDSIRRNQRLLQFLLVLLIFPAFALFGLSGYERFFAGDTAVAVVGESEISAQEFENARRAQLQNLQRMLGDRVDPAMLDTPGARQQVLENLVGQRVLALEASRARIGVSDDEVRAEIARIPGILGPDGAFDMERYRMLLAAEGTNEVQFEQRVRADLVMQTIPRALTETEFVPRSVLERLARLAGEQREYRMRTFSPEEFVERVEVDEAAARAFYDENPNLFEAPENAKVAYLVLSQQALAANENVTDDELRAYYEQNGARFVQAEQRRARHVLFTVAPDATDTQREEVRQKAAATLERLRGGADFAEVARAESQDPGSAQQGGDLGFFDRQTMVAPFAQAAFALDRGKLSDPVETEFGIHLIEVTDIKPEARKPFEEVKDELAAEIRQQKARAAFLERADTFGNTIYEQPDSLEPAAEKLGLQIAVADDVRTNGGPALAPDSPLADPRVLRALFDPRTLADKTNTEAIDVGDNTLIAARVLEHRPKRLKDFDEVKAEAISRVRAREAARLAREAGQQTLTSLQSAPAGTEPEGFGGPTTAGRDGARLPQPAIEALFGASAENLPRFVGADLGLNGYRVFQLLKVTPPSDEELKQQLEAVGQQFDPAFGQASFDAYLAALKGRTEILRHPERLSAGNAALN